MVVVATGFWEVKREGARCLLFVVVVEKKHKQKFMKKLTQSWEWKTTTIPENNKKKLHWLNKKKNTSGTQDRERKSA